MSERALHSPCFVGRGSLFDLSQPPADDLHVSVVVRTTLLQIVPLSYQLLQLQGLFIEGLPILVILCPGVGVRVVVGISFDVIVLHVLIVHVGERIARSL